MPPKSAAEYRAEQAAEEAARQKKLYGDHLPAVLLLRKRGFVVTREGAKVRVGNKLLAFDEVETMAAREGGLAGTPVRQVGATSGGLKVGDSVPIAPKARPSPLLSTAKQKLVGAALANKTKATEHSTDLGTKPRVVWLDLDLLSIDTSYQRAIAQAGAAHINRILKAFNWNCYQPIIVAEREDGTYAVIDGQHRLEAAKKHPLIKSIPCYIIDAPDVAQQAAVFAAVNSRRLALTSQQQFFAALAAGDAAAREADSVARGAGVTILRAPPSYDIPPRSIVAPFTLLKLLRQVGRPAVSGALKMLAEAHPDTKNAFRAPTFAAISRLLADAALDTTRLKPLLAKLDLTSFYDDVRNERISGAGTLESAAERLLRRQLQPLRKAA